MSLSSLPWFIRRQIIDLVIEESPEYCSISREWMRQVAIQHGEVRLGYNIPDIRLISPFSPYIERINFYRSTNIDWDTLLLYRNLKHVDICFLGEENEDYTEFTSKLERLPPLSSLQLMLQERREADLSKVLKKGKDYILRLEIEADSIDWYPFNLIFSKLKSLNVKNTKCQFPVQYITKNMPNINKLIINNTISFNNDVMTTILELEVNNSRFITNATLEISLFPQLKRLIVDGILLTSLKYYQNKIESLIISGTAIQIMQIRNISFPNLKELDLSNNENGKFQGLVNLFQHLTTLTTLTKFKLEVLQETDFPTNLPVGPYSITDLTLQGLFPITPSSLTWFSQSFNLIKLKLLFCTLDDDVNLPVVPFKYLNSLEILTDCFYICNFEAHFNKFHYPHVKITTLGRFD